MEIKLPVKWLREKGVELELDDIWFSDHTLLNEKISTSTIAPFNDGMLDYLFITSFAYRECTGDQPVEDSIPVCCTLNDGSTVIGVGSSFRWWRSCNDEAMARWKPNAKALMDMYTAEQSAKLTETKKETKLRLTIDDVGKKFENEAFAVFEVTGVGTFSASLKSMGNVEYVWTCELDGSIHTAGKYKDNKLVKRHEPRYWLKDLPDADLFILFDMNYLFFVGGYWSASQDEPILNDDHFQYDSHMTTTLLACLMPQLKGDEWKLSKISIDDLRVWQKENK